MVSDDEGTGIQVWGAVFAAPCTVKAARVGNVEPQRAWPITAGLRPTRLWRRRADAECGDTRQLVRREAFGLLIFEQVTCPTGTITRRGVARAFGLSRAGTFGRVSLVMTKL